MKWVVRLVLVAAVVWVAGDFGYSRIIAHRLDVWDATVTRDESGVQVGAESYSMGSGSTALLLVHGFNDTPQTFARMAPVLADAGFFVRAVRLPGAGVRVDRSGSVQYVDWVRAVADEAAELARNHDPVVAVGHSLGAAILLKVSLAQRHDIDGLVLLAPAIAVSDDRSPLLPARFWQSLADRLLVFSDVYQSPFDGNDAADPDVRNPEYKPPFTNSNEVRQTTRLMDLLAETAPRISVPTLMVLSRTDRIIDWRAAKAYFDDLGSARKRLVFYDSSRHALTVDLDWRKIVTDIETFARETPDASSRQSPK